MIKARDIIYNLETDIETKNLMLESFKKKLKISGKNIYFFNKPFTPISLTGKKCSLKCKHCNRHYLNHMLDGTEKKLYSHAENLAKHGEKGILLSGGSSEKGSVETYKFSNDIKIIKLRTGLKISAHTGIMEQKNIETLSEFLDMALIDVIGDDDTIKDILGLDASIEDYEATIKAVSYFGIPFAPHIIVGLNYGKLKGEFKALEIVKKYNPDVVVIVVFIPTKNTDLENIKPPEIKDVVKVITKAREIFDVPISLSCVRPGGRYRSILDRYAILSGIDRLAVPTKSAYQTCRELGLDVITVSNMCCSY